MQVCAIEQAAIFRRKAAAQNVPAEVGVAAVGQRATSRPPSASTPAQVAQQDGGAAQVLQHVGADHEIEAAVQRRQTQVQIGFQQFDGVRKIGRAPRRENRCR